VSTAVDPAATRRLLHPRQMLTNPIRSIPDAICVDYPDGWYVDVYTSTTGKTISVTAKATCKTCGMPALRKQRKIGDGGGDWKVLPCDHRGDVNLAVQQDDIATATAILAVLDHHDHLDAEDHLHP
jgi:hypothetical protein